MPLIILLTSLSISFFTTVFSQFPQDYTPQQMEVLIDDEKNLYMHNDALYKEKWDQLNETKFWRGIMLLTPDSTVLNIAESRVILEIVNTKEWESLSAETRSDYRNELRVKNGLDSSERIYATSGKNHFYKFDLAMPTIPDGIRAFEKNEVDPWYAQAILLIESPGQLKKSTSGAYGPFQLMPAVARANGLTVNRYVDERKDFDLSAIGASNLINTVCIPKAKEILDAQGMPYNTSDIWFRLFVLHVYHAGSGNVKAVVNKINPQNMSGQQLIQEMWHTKAAAFGNNSQNYTQLALASQMVLQEQLQAKGGEILYCTYP
jgi:hypothetical protein